MDWDKRYADATRALVPWIEKSRTLSGARVLDFRCGTGAITAAIAPLADRVVGLDIDDSAVDEASRRLAAAGVKNVDLASGGPEELERRARDLAGSVDVFLLVSALEHMKLDERQAVLAVAAEVLADDGVIVVCESPNRLLPWDYHTSGLPFFGMLPDELALRYAERSERPDFRDQIAEALAEGASAARERLARWGRGVSFHEFELAFSDFPANVVGAAYEEELLAIRPVHREELALARFLKGVRADLPPSFSRYWIDLIIARQPGDSKQAWIEPWPFETTQSRYVDLTEWDTLLLRGPHARLTAGFGGPVQEIVVGIADPIAPLELRIRSPEGAQVRRRVGASDPPSPEYISVSLDDRPHAVTIDASEACHVAFLGFARAS